MKTIRRGVFETNSSSTHSISIVAKEDYDKWSDGELLKSYDRFVTKEEAIEEIKKDEYFNKNYKNFDFSNEEEVNDLLKEWDYKSYEDYGNDYEYFSKSYKTKNGDEVVAFGYYGYDN